MSIISIVAVDINNGIGKDGRMLFHIKEDMKWFKNHTINKIIIMGRKTFESIGKPLADRINVVLSSSSNFDGCINIHSFTELLNYINRQTSDVFIIGGETLYKQMLPYCNKIILTKVYAQKDADTFFPNIDNSWELVDKSDILNTEVNSIQFLTYEKKIINGDKDKDED